MQTGSYDPDPKHGLDIECKSSGLFAQPLNGEEHTDRA